MFIPVRKAFPSIRKGIPCLLAVIALALFIPGGDIRAAVPQEVLDQAWLIGTQIKEIQDQTVATNEKKRSEEAAALQPVKEMQAQAGLLKQELAAIRNIYRSDRQALAVVDGKSAGPSNAADADVSRAAELRAELAALEARIKEAQAAHQELSKQYAAELSRLSQAKTRVDLELRRLRAPYANDPEGLAEIDTKVTNAQGKQTSAQIAEARELKRKEEAAKRQEERDAPGREAIRAAQARVPDRLLGRFEPTSEFEKDVLDAALMNIEGNLLKASPRARDQIVQARIKELNEALKAINGKHAASERSEYPFRAQWLALSKAQFPPNEKTLIEPIRELYRPILTARQEQKAAQARFELIGMLLYFAGNTLSAALVLAAIVWLARRRAQSNDGIVPKFTTFAVDYFKANWLWLIPSLIAMLINPLLGLVVLGVAFGVKTFIVSWAQKRRRLAWMKAEPQKVMYEWFEELGKTPEQAISNINRIFDERKRTLSHALFHNFQDTSHDDKVISARLFFRISRNLATMEPREREFLRVVELLNVLDEADAEKGWYGWARFGLIWGNGKATVDDYSYRMWATEKGVRDGPSAIRWFMEKSDASVDSVINAVLQRLEKKAAEASAKPELARLIKDVNKRVRGGTQWLAAEDVDGSAFARRSDFALRLGLLDDTDVPLEYSGEGCMVTIAPPRSGKTQCHVFPNLLAWRGPALVLDVKGEIYAGTSKWRAENVGPVFRFSPLDPSSSHSYNPLSFVRQETDYIWEDSRLLADMMIVPSGASDPFWENKARDVLTAAIAYLCYSNPPDRRPMDRIIDIIHGGQAWEEMVSGLQMAMDVRSMVQQGTSLAGMNEKTRDSVLQTAQSSLSAWSGERIRRVTDKSDWSPLDLRDDRRPPTVYICLKPSEVESYTSLLRVFIAQHIRMLTNELPPRGSAPILFLLDELPRLRYMPPIEEAIEIGGQYGLRLWMFAQSLGQLEAAYPNANGMVASCAVRAFMNPSGADGTADRLSEELGYRESVMDGSRQKLVEATELSGPEFQHYQVVMAHGSKPAKVKKAFAWQDAELSARMGSL
ncbi:type IV secretory system conjugative DNA transfer family protein [Methylocaldum szegediense]|uniref:type IV secretory system conjugative DNA transfer family protein n=1 Tax=Methylocaldum szegediense TaxID=73780 RepID=UPI00041AE787|nr:type IV secretory system conjugative DNA transfer family protein [Methylocaldum szegediense]